jgi:hypothetical protein
MQPHVQVLFRPLFEIELLDIPVEQFLASLKLENRGEIGSFIPAASRLS